MHLLAKTREIKRIQNWGIVVIGCNERCQFKVIQSANPGLSTWITHTMVEFPCSSNTIIYLPYFRVICYEKFIWLHEYQVHRKTSCYDRAITKTDNGMCRWLSIVSSCLNWTYGSSVNFDDLSRTNVIENFPSSLSDQVSHPRVRTEQMGAQPEMIWVCNRISLRVYIFVIEWKILSSISIHNVASTFAWSFETIIDARCSKWKDKLD